MNIPLIKTLMRLTPIKRQSTLSFGFTIITSLAVFFSTMLFSHLLGADLIGVFYLFFTYFSIFNLIGDMGFGGAAIKRISEGKEQNEYFSAYITLRAVLVIVSTLILLFMAQYFVDLADYNLIPPILAALIIAFFAHGLYYGVVGLGCVGVTNVATGISDLAKIVVQIILVLIGFSYLGMIGGVLVGLLISGLICLKYFTLRPAKYSFKHIKSLFGFGFWVLLTSSAATIITYADTIFIGYFMANADVGVYRVVLQFTTISIFIMSAINSTLAPKISFWSSNNHIEEIPPVIARGITYSLILAVPVAIGGFLLSERLLYFFYGAAFSVGASSLCILLVYQIVVVFLTLFSSALGNSNHPRQGFYGTLVALIINVILDIILIPIIGIDGAAIGSLLCAIGNTIIIIHFLKKYMPVKVESKPILHILIASLIMGAFVFAYKSFIPLDNVVVTLIPVAIGGIIYLILLFKLDKGIQNEIADIVTNFGIKWPKWL